ncbi:MAG: hypothetical protein LAP21_11660 [Acidobacteriia bacterium]|nr:hypothetical protein [Terriglobia bacterium]
MSNHHNRVLIRAGARELTQQEVEKVQGGKGTTTVCTIDGPAFKDGDPGEC